MHLSWRCVAAWNVFLAQWPINFCSNRNIWINAPAEEVPERWLPGSCWGEKMGEIKLQTSPVIFSSKPLLPICIGNRLLSCIWLYGSFLGVGSVLGKSLEPEKSRENWKPGWFEWWPKAQIKCEIHSWPLSLLDKRNQIPCLLLQNGPDWPFPFLAPHLSCSLRSSFNYCFIFASWSIIQTDVLTDLQLGGEERSVGEY